MKNYRPVSNLNFISTIIEKNISNRIRFHLDKNNLSNLNQSAYKPLHYTETALLEIHNEICMSMESGKTTALVLLDLSAAFDTMVHSSIIELLYGWYDISGTALYWVRSYRVQGVKRLDKLGERLRRCLPGLCPGTTLIHYHIRDLRRLRRCLTAAVTKTIAASLVSSKLDYCNYILYNIPNRKINKLR